MQIQNDHFANPEWPVCKSKMTTLQIHMKIMQIQMKTITYMEHGEYMPLCLFSTHLEIQVHPPRWAHSPKFLTSTSPAFT